jgi:hypothetical protein
VSLTNAQPVVLWEVTGSTGYEKLGRSVAGAGDLNGDGYADFMAGIPGGYPAGRVEVYSGIDGQILHTLEGTVGGGYFGMSVANAGDVDDDGVPDIIVGAPSYYPGASAPKGHVQVFSGADGSVLHTITDLSNASLFGQSVAGVGDVDADGHADFLVGAPGGGGTPGFVKLFSRRGQQRSVPRLQR